MALLKLLLKRLGQILLVALLSVVVLGAFLVGIFEFAQGNPGTYVYEGRVIGLDYGTNDKGEILGLGIKLDDVTVNGCKDGLSRCNAPDYPFNFKPDEVGQISLGDRATIQCVALPYSLTNPLRTSCTVLKVVHK